MSDTAFVIKLARSGKTITVPADMSALTALVAAGITIETSCEQGICGTCLIPVLEGEPDHRDMFLTSDEQDKNDQFTPCCSRAKSSVLVLDL